MIVLFWIGVFVWFIGAIVLTIATLHEVDTFGYSHSVDTEGLKTNGEVATAYLKFVLLWPLNIVDWWKQERS